MAIEEHFRKPLRKVPGIVAGTLVGFDTNVVGMGSVAEGTDPGSLCFEIGSITKVFTGILLAEMSLRDEVGLDDPIGAHLPDEVAGRLPASNRQPTLRDLATHTAGLPRLPMSMIRKVGKSNDPYSQLTVEDVWAPLGPKTVRPKRRRTRYSNWGMGLLGHLLEHRAGIPYPALIEERLLDPLELHATGVEQCAEGVPTVQGFRKRKPTPPWRFGALAGAGALRSTANDLLRFAGAILNPPGGIVGEALELARQAHHGGTGPSGGTGLGWHLRPRPPRQAAAESVWHDGGTYGAASFLAVDPPGMRAVVALGNRGPGLFPPLNGAAWSLFDGLG